jgi:predicted porin
MKAGQERRQETGMRRTATCLAAAALAAAIASGASAADSDGGDPGGADLSGQVARLRAEIARQQRQLSEQQQKITAQQAQLQQLEDRVDARIRESTSLAKLRGAGQPGAASGGALQTAQAAPPSQQAVGQAPAEEKQRPEVAVLSNLGGVLTPRDHLTFEPFFEYDNQQFNQLFFSGTEIVSAVFVGGLDATSARRNTLIGGFNARYGITSDLEASLRVPYVYRSDREANTIDSNVLNTNVTGRDIGDIEFGLHYQLNTPTDGGAYYVANLRVKSDTGRGPFDVPYFTSGPNLGAQASLPTGSGFWAVEPSLTVLYPYDPVVLFANTGYTINIGKAIDKMVAPGQYFGEVDPGDVLRFSGGIAFSINDRVALNLAYEHDWVMSTTSVLNGLPASSDQLQIGMFVAGISYALSPSVTANVSVSVGATRDAPDERILLSLPISLDLTD